MQRKLSYILILTIIILGLFIYTHSSSDLFSRSDKPTPVSVTTKTVTPKDVTIYFDTIGTVTAYATVNVKSLVDGQILKVSFSEGQNVQQGQLLFTLDSRPFQIQLQQTQANLAKDQAQLTNAKLALQRYNKLLKQGYVTPQDYDQTRANAEALAATVQADNAAIANAQLQLSYTHITAPISGHAGDVLIEAGNLIKTAADAVLVTINQIQPIYIVFTIPQKYLPLIQKQQSIAPLKVIAHIDKTHTIEQGQLTFINNAIDTATGTIQLKSSFANTDELLWPGQFVNISLSTAFIKNALIVPASAVKIGQKGAYVFLVRDHKAYFQPVKIRATVKEGIIVEQGLKAGEQVVVDGQFLLTDGTPVKVVC